MIVLFCIGLVFAALLAPGCFSHDTNAMLYEGLLLLVLGVIINWTFLGNRILFFARKLPQVLIPCGLIGTALMYSGWQLCHNEKNYIIFVNFMLFGVLAKFIGSWQENSQTMLLSEILQTYKQVKMENSLSEQQVLALTAAKTLLKWGIDKDEMFALMEDFQEKDIYGTVEFLLSLRDVRYGTNHGFGIDDINSVKDFGNYTIKTESRKLAINDILRFHKLPILMTEKELQDLKEFKEGLPDLKKTVRNAK